MKEQTFDRSADTVPFVGVPHFDDERTILSARPVVPLEKIDAKLRNRRRWFLGSAFAIAMTLGAASALLASYLRLRNVNNAVSEISQVELTPAPLAIPETAPATEEDPVTTALEDSSAVASLEEEPVPFVPAKKETASRRRTVVRREPDFVPSAGPRMNEEEELERIRDAVLIDEWQERRMRRALRRERRRAERDNRDLSNLDEIFEGRRRPLNP